jgi:sec-independent protein translocase protein TatA
VTYDAPISNNRKDTMIGNIFTPTHLLLVLAVALIVLGPKRLPEAGRGLGSAIRGFKESLSTDEPSKDHPAIETSHRQHENPDAPDQST